MTRSQKEALEMLRIAADAHRIGRRHDRWLHRSRLTGAGYINSRCAAALITRGWARGVHGAAVEITGAGLKALLDAELER